MTYEEFYRKLHPLQPPTDEEVDRILKRVDEHIQQQIANVPNYTDDELNRSLSGAEVWKHNPTFKCLYDAIITEIDNRRKNS